MIMILFWLRPWSCGELVQNKGICTHTLKDILLVIYMIFDVAFHLKVIFCNFFYQILLHPNG